MQRDCPVKDEEVVEFLKLCASWKIMLHPMTGNIIISEVDAFMYFVLCKAGKHMPCGELVGTTLYDIIAEVIITEFNCTSYLQLH